MMNKNQKIVIVIYFVLLLIILLFLTPYGYYTKSSQGVIKSSSTKFLSIFSTPYTYENWACYEMLYGQLLIMVGMLTGIATIVFFMFKTPKIK